MLIFVGPFELTKLSAQIAVLMQNGGDAEGNVSQRSSNQPSKSQFQGNTAQSAGSPAPNKAPKQKILGAFGTASSIVRQRGFLGLYSGFHLHLSK